LLNSNVGSVDRIVRIGGGVALIAFALGYLAPGTGYNWLGWIGVVPLATAAFGTCPLYSLLGLSTCSVAKPG
jgi:hypothetical protein